MRSILFLQTIPYTVIVYFSSHISVTQFSPSTINALASTFSFRRFIILRYTSDAKHRSSCSLDGNRIIITRCGFLVCESAENLIAAHFCSHSLKQLTVFTNNGFVLNIGIYPASHIFLKPCCCSNMVRMGMC